MNVMPLAHPALNCAAKASLHSFAQSHRYQLAERSTQVIKIAPQQVDTDLGTPGSNAGAMPVDEFADEAMRQILDGSTEVTVGFGIVTGQGTVQERAALFSLLNPEVR